MSAGPPRERRDDAGDVQRRVVVLSGKEASSGAGPSFAYRRTASQDRVGGRRDRLADGWAGSDFAGSGGAYGRCLRATAGAGPPVERCAREPSALNTLRPPWCRMDGPSSARRVPISPVRAIHARSAARAPERLGPSSERRRARRARAVARSPRYSSK